MQFRMRETWKPIILICIIAAFMLVQIAPFSAAYAAASPIAAAPTGNSMVANCDEYPGISNRIVQCIRATLENAGEKFFADFYPMLSRSVIAIITLGVVIYGVMMAAGMVEKIGRDSMVLLIKIAFVAYFVQHTDLLYDWVVDSMDSLGASMFSFSNLNHPTASVCMAGKETIWERLDCLIDTTIGIRDDSATSGVTGAGSVEGSSNIELSGHGLTRGLIAFFCSALLSSVPGFIIGIIGIMFLYTMLFFMVQVVFTFLMSYMALMFLMMIGPMFIPLVIFKTTKQYFDKWVGLIISFALQPVIIIAFVSFAVAGIDVTVFSGEKSFVRAIAGDAVDERPFNLNQYIDSKGGYVERDVGPKQYAEDSRTTTENTQTIQGFAGLQTIGDCGLRGSEEQMAERAQRCVEGWVVGISTHSIDWAVLAEARSPEVVMGEGVENKEEALMQELYASAILTAVMMFVMSALLKVVPQIANDLVGSYRQTPNAFSAATKWNWQGQAGNSMTQGIQNMVNRR
jgi:hypothetical protein